MITELITNLDKIANYVDNKIIPSNIREGIELFGVEGTLEPLSTQRKEVNPDLVTHVVVPDASHNGIHEVIVNGVKHTIDKNIIPENIRSGKSIIGIEGLLSRLTEEEYNQALIMQIEILGYTIYVINSKLLLEGSEYNVEGTTLELDNCTVNNGIIEFN